MSTLKKIRQESKNQSGEKHKVDQELIISTWLLLAVVGLIGGFLVPALWSGLRARHLSEEEELAVWASFQNIDNPLTPWPELYAHELDLRYSPRLSEGKVGLAEVRRALQLTRKVTRVGLALGIVWYLLFWPLLTFSSNFLSFYNFYISIIAIEAWNVMVLLVCLFMPIRMALLKFLPSGDGEGYENVKPEKFIPRRHAVTFSLSLAIF
nr:unnamed protein product [Spirometra erinaceieuropaei]